MIRSGLILGEPSTITGERMGSLVGDDDLDRHAIEPKDEDADDGDPADDDELAGARRGRCDAGGGRTGVDSAEALDKVGDPGGERKGLCAGYGCFTGCDFP